MSSFFVTIDRAKMESGHIIGVSMGEFRACINEALKTTFKIGGAEKKKKKRKRKRKRKEIKIIREENNTNPNNKNTNYSDEFSKATRKGVLPKRSSAKTGCSLDVGSSSAA